MLEDVFEFIVPATSKVLWYFVIYAIYHMSIWSAAACTLSKSTSCVLFTLKFLIVSLNLLYQIEFSNQANVTNTCLCLTFIYIHNLLRDNEMCDTI